MKFLDQLTLPHRVGAAAAFRGGFFAGRNRPHHRTGVGTVKSRLHYAKRTLRKLLEESEP